MKAARPAVQLCCPYQSVKLHPSLAMRSMFGVRYPMMPLLFMLTLNQPMSSPQMIRMLGLFVAMTAVPPHSMSSGCSAVMRLVHALRLGRHRAGALRLTLPFAYLLQIPLEEIVQERPDDGDRAELEDGCPAGADRCLDDVGRQLEREPRDQPARVAQPHIALLVARLRREDRPQTVDECLDGPDDDDQHRH